MRRSLPIPNNLDDALRREFAEVTPEGSHREKEIVITDDIAGQFDPVADTCIQFGVIGIH